MIPSTLTPVRTRVLAVVAVLLASSTVADAATVGGHVTDLDGSPLVGVNVSIVGQQSGDISDEHGEYSIEGVTPGVQRLRASLVGYLASLSDRVEIGSAAVTVDFVMREEPIEMSTVVISASAIGEEVRRAPNRVQIVSREHIEATPARNIQEVLQGIEGLYVSRGEGVLVTFPQIIVRGMSTGYLG